MKILMVNVVCGIRSTGRICTDLAVELERQGHEVKIAYGRGNVPVQFQKYALRIGSDFDVYVHALKARLFDSAGFASKRATINFVEWIKKYNPDIIHLHNLHGYYINLEIFFRYLKESGKKIIWTLHDCWAVTGHSGFCDAVKCERWKSGCFSCPLKKEYPKAFVDHSRINWNKKKKITTNVPNLSIVTPSFWLASIIKQSYLAQYPIEVIHNGIDLKYFRKISSDFRKKNDLQGKRLLLGVASAWNDLKGFADFKKLSEMLDDTYKIILVGLSLNQLKKVPLKIIGIPKTNSIQELIEIYSACDIFLNLTYCDTYPTVNLEAISCGLPVITYRTGGSPESIEDGMGVVVEQGDVKAVYNMINVLYDKKESGKPMTSKIIEKDKFDKTISISKYLSRYFDK